MASQVVRVNANLQPEVASALDDLANRIGGNRTTALHQAILLADLLYKEADARGTIQIKKAGFAPRTVVLPKIDPELARRVTAELEAKVAAPAIPIVEEDEAAAQAAESADTSISGPAQE
jgi:hypothetical protein